MQVGGSHELSVRPRAPLALAGNPEEHLTEGGYPNEVDAEGEPDRLARVPRANSAREVQENREDEEEVGRKEQGGCAEEEAFRGAPSQALRARD